MTTRLFAAAAGVLLVTGTPALADSTSSGTTQPTTKSDDGEQNKVVCRRIESIGTRLNAKRVCRTKGEWDAEQAANRMDLERNQTQRQGRDGS